MKANIVTQSSSIQPSKFIGWRLFYTIAIATSLCMSAADSAAAHHGGGHTIEVDPSGQAYEKVGPNWQQVTTTSATVISGLSLLGLGGYWLRKSHAQQKKP